MVIVSFVQQYFLIFLIEQFQSNFSAVSAIDIFFGQNLSEFCFFKVKK